MLDPVKSSPAGARIGATRAATPPAASTVKQVTAASGDESVDNDNHHRPQARDHEAENESRDERKAAIDHAIEGLLKDAARVGAETASTRPSSGAEVVPFAAPTRKHVMVTGLYARHERIDNRDAVLKPGAVFSASF